MNQFPLHGRLYQAIPGFEDHLFAELPEIKALYDTETELQAPLFHDPNPVSQQIFWHQNCWLEPFRLEFGSINEAATALRAIQRNWAGCLHTQFRRGALIESRLPTISNKPRPFPWQVGDSPMGAWTLLDANTMIASARCSSPFPNGCIEFAEDKQGPPSRAYLKIWEALVRLRKWPAQGERCLDAGASPGSWTWALAQLGAQVLAVDRAPLEDRIKALPGIEYMQHDALTLKPQDIGPIDWLFCDVACYPPRLFQWIEKWLTSGLCHNFVCTIKMQGNVDARSIDANTVDFDTPRRFAEIPGSTLVHLYHNKHELTWTYCINPP
jgi:23S rRNA (cytidine2498-2'-O)-methyltransferase